MTSSFTGHSIRLIGPNQVCVEGAGINWECTIPPLACLHVQGEVAAASDPARWPILPLGNRRHPGMAWPAPGACDPSSLRVYKHLPTGERQELRRDADFTVDPQFCGVTLTAAEGAEVIFSLDYHVRRQRVDVIAVREGELRLFTGAESVVCPPWPVLPEGWDGIARIHRRYTETLAETDLYPITDPAFARVVNLPVRSDGAARMPSATAPETHGSSNTPLWTDAIDYRPYIQASPAALERLRQSFTRNEPFRLVTFGDSVTQGGDVNAEWRWPGRVHRYLQSRYPEREIHLANAAIGGTNSSFGRERFDRDVLVHEPHVATILFPLNDKGMDDDTFRANHEYFIQELRARNCEPVLLTSNMNTGIWMDGLDHAEERICELAREHDLVCLDTYAIWKDLGKWGIPYESLLSNGINHPDNVAAGLYYELLLAALIG